jgi:hypothetical protein
MLIPNLFTVTIFSNSLILFFKYSLFTLAALLVSYCGIFAESWNRHATIGELSEAMLFVGPMQRLYQESQQAESEVAVR